MRDIGVQSLPYNCLTSGRRKEQFGSVDLVVRLGVGPCSRSYSNVTPTSSMQKP